MPSFPICHFHLKLIERVSRETKSLGVGEYKLFQRLISSLVMYHIFFYQTCWLSEPLVLSFTEVLSLTLLRTIVRGVWHLEITSKLVSMVYGMPAKGVGPKREGWRCVEGIKICSLLQQSFNVFIIFHYDLLSTISTFTPRKVPKQLVFQFCCCSNSGHTLLQPTTSFNPHPPRKQHSSYRL